MSACADTCVCATATVDRGSSKLGSFQNTLVFLKCNIGV